MGVSKNAAFGREGERPVIGNKVSKAKFSLLKQFGPQVGHLCSCDLTALLHHGPDLDLERYLPDKTDILVSLASW